MARFERRALRAAWWRGRRVPRVNAGSPRHSCGRPALTRVGSPVNATRRDVSAARAAVTAHIAVNAATPARRRVRAALTRRRGRRSPRLDAAVLRARARHRERAAAGIELGVVCADRRTRVRRRRREAARRATSALGGSAGLAVEVAERLDAEADADAAQRDLLRAREVRDVVRLARAERDEREPLLAGPEGVRDAGARRAGDDAPRPHRMLLVAEQQRPLALEH